MKMNVPFILIGKEMTDEDIKRIDALESSFCGKLTFDRSGPFYRETEVLDAAASITADKPPAVIVDVLSGGSARQAVLAALKTGVPVMIWCHDLRHSLASASIAAGALDKLFHPYILVHGEGKKAAAEILDAVTAAYAVHKLRNSRIGRLGPLHFNLINSETDPLEITKRFGSWIVPLSVQDLKKRAAEVSDERIRQWFDELDGRCRVRAEENVLSKALALRAALFDIAREERLDAIAVDCWNEIVPETGANPCLGFAFDDFIIACEGDIGLAVTLIAGRVLSGAPGFCGDLYAADHESGEVSLLHCAGSCGLHCGDGPMEISAVKPPVPGVSANGIVTARPVLRKGPGVLLLLHGSGLGTLHIRKCEVTGTDLEDQMKVRVRIDDCGGFISGSAGNHYVVFPGGSAGAWMRWGAWSGIEIR